MTDNPKSPTWCRTFTGVGFDLHDLGAQVPQLEDVAHHLAMLCRYGGACPVFYSVAQHATMAARAVFVATQDPGLALLALHHDDAEAYLYDIRRPHKRGVWFEEGATGVRVPFARVEVSVQSWIFAHLLPPLVVAWECTGNVARGWVKRADDAALRAEYLGLFPEGCDEDLPEEDGVLRVAPVLPEDCLDWSRAKAGFLRMHRFLLRELQAVEVREGATLTAPALAKTGGLEVREGAFRGVWQVAP